MLGVRKKARMAVIAVRRSLVPHMRFQCRTLHFEEIEYRAWYGHTHNM